MKPKAIDRNGRELYAARPTHPGVVPGEELEARQLNPSSLAISLGLPPTGITDLIKGNRPISAVLARQLEDALTLSGGYWMRLQVNYDLQVERLTAFTA